METILGEVYQDMITGFEGVATSRTTYLYGCVRVALEPKTLHEGKPIEANYFDEQRLVHVKSGEKVTTDAKSGGDWRVPPRRDPPAR
jgi:hypothetical protein